MRFDRRFFILATGRLALLPLIGPFLKGEAAKANTSLAREGSSELPIMPANPLVNPVLATRIKAISNVFEVGSPEPDYAYVEDLGDGRGYTVTQYGFCTYNDEVSWVIGRHMHDVPATPLARFLPHLPPVLQGGGTQGLAGFPQAWQAALNASPLLAAACDEEADRLYLFPATEAAKAVDVHSPVGLSIFYDTWLQHGGSTDADSLGSILARTVAQTGGRGNCSESEFLRAFLDIRKSVLENPANHETREVWRRSARRVDALLALLDDNPELEPPVNVVNDDIEAVVL